MFKVYLQVGIPERPVDPTKDAHFLCYGADSPIPWDKKIFVVTDARNRMWFCHEFNGTLTHPELQKVGNEIQAEYANIKRQTPLIVQIVAARANDLDELNLILSKAELKA